MAIAYISSVSNGGSSTSLTTSFNATSAATDRILILFFSCKGSVSGTPKFNGVNMTQIFTIGAGGNFNNSYAYYLKNPDSGTYNIYIASDTSGYIFMAAGLYSGVDQTTPVPQNGSTSGTGTSLTKALTTTVDNSWLLGSSEWIASVDRGTLSAGADTTFRTAFDNFQSLLDSNAAKTPAGAYSIDVHFSISSSYNLMVISLAPVTVTAPTVTTQAASSVLSTSFTGNGNITATGGANATRRGFCYFQGGSSGELYTMPFISDANLKAYWRFEYNSTDETANKQDGTDTSMSYATAKFNKGAVFSGSGYVTLPSGAGTALDITGDFTIALWINRGTSNGCIIDCSDEVSYDDGYMLFVGGGGAASGHLAVELDSNWYVEAGTAIGTGWHHIAVTLSGTSLKFYLDGTQNDTTKTAVACTSWSGARTIGTQNTGSNKITATMDDLCVFNRALTDAEILKIYSNNPTTSDSVAYDDGDFGTGAFTKSVTGLTAGTAYRVRAYAINSAGTSYGATVDVVTPSANLGRFFGLF